MSTYDLGDTARLAVQVTDSTGTLANATAVSLVVTLPDGTSSGSLTPTNTATGVYQYDYTPSQVGRHGVRWVATGTNAGAFTDVFTVLDPAELPVVGLAEAKAQLRRTDTADDEAIRRMLGVATDLCERHSGHVLRRRTVVESHEMAGYSSTLVLRRFPVLSVSTVTVDGTATTAYTADTALGLLRFDFCPTGTVAVTYVAGYSAPPPVAEEAVLVTLDHLWENRQQTVRPAFGGTEDAAYAPGAAYALPRRAEQLLAALGPTTGMA